MALRASIFRALMVLGAVILLSALGLGAGWLLKTHDLLPDFFGGQGRVAAQGAGADEDESETVSASASASASISASPFASAAAVPPNATFYSASAPHRGYAHRTVDFPVRNIAGGLILVFIEGDEEGADLLAAQQPVLFYDDAAEPLPILGQVESVRQGLENFAGHLAVRIRFEAVPLVDLAEASRAAVIVEQRELANRLPETALVADPAAGSKSGYILWEAVRTQAGGHVARRRFVDDVMVMEGGLAAFAVADYISNIYILNPDANLREGQALTITETAFNAGPVTRPQAVEMARESWLADIARQQAAHEARRIERDSIASCSTQCAAQVVASEESFVDRIRRMAREMR